MIVQFGKHKSVLVGISIAAFVVYAVMTGGLWLESIRDFGGQTEVRLVEGLKADAWLEPRSSRLGVPFIFHYYAAREPFGLRLQIWDESRRFRAVEITEVVVEYKDGLISRRATIWSRQLRPYTQYNSSSAGLIKTDLWMLSDRIEGLVLRHADVTISLKGESVGTRGERSKFEASQSFKAESRLQVLTYWTVLAGC